MGLTVLLRINLNNKVSFFCETCLIFNLFLRFFWYVIIVFFYKMDNKDEIFMRRAVQIAYLAAGRNQPNPYVGAVLVCKNSIIGEGFHHLYGQAHAEVNAIANVKAKNRHLIAESCLYVTLEPCFHFGKTPPCVDLVLKHQIKRVVIGCEDIFPQVAGQSIAKLRAAGVEVRLGVLEAEIKWLTRHFFSNVRLQRPYIILKWAMSKDGFFSKKGEKIQISNPLSQRLLHRWRGQEQAILVGKNTAEIDNPRLDGRFYADKNPLRLLIDENLSLLGKNLHLFDNQLATWVICKPEKAKSWENLDNLRYVGVEFGANFIPNLLAYLYQNNIKSLIVEGGANVLTQFLSLNLWDEARVFVGCDCLREGIAAPSIAPHLLVESFNLDHNQVQLFVNQ